MIMRITKFDNVFQFTGGMGRFQVSLFLSVGVVCYLNAFHLMGMTMLGANVDHWCKVDRLMNFSYEQQKYISIPFKDSEHEMHEEYSECQMYNLSYEDMTDSELWNWNRTTDVNDDTEIIYCTSWMYDQSLFLNNALTMFNLVCDRSSLLPLTSAIYQLGILSAAVLSGYLSDRFGRKKILDVGIIGFILTSFSVIFVPGYWAFTIIRYLLSLTQHIGFLCAFVLILEMTGAKHRNILGCLYHMLFSFGSMTMAITSYYIRDYTRLCICWAVPILLCLLLIGITPESARWLVTKGKFEEAKQIVQTMALTNGRKCPTEIEFVPNIEINVVKETMQVHSEQAHDLGRNSYTTNETMKDVFTSKILRMELFIIYIGWFANNLLYYGLSLNAGSLPGSIFLNVFLMSSIEIPAVVICILGLYFIGRKSTLVYGLLAAGIFNLLCIPFIGDSNVNNMVTTFSVLGKACVKLSFVCIYVFTGEMFPTPVRHLAIGSASMISKIGGVIAPYMGETLISVWQPLPSLIFGSIAIFAGLLSLWLPETLGRPLPDTIAEAEQLSQSALKSRSKQNIKAPINDSVDETEQQSTKL